VAQQQKPQSYALQQDEAVMTLAAARDMQETYITEVVKAAMTPALNEFRDLREAIDRRMQGLEESLQQLEGRVSLAEKAIDTQRAALGTLEQGRLAVKPETLLGLIQGQAEIKSWLAMLSQRLDAELGELRQTLHRPSGHTEGAK